jgi:hypothetical protein
LANAATFSIPNASPSGIPAVFNIVMVWKLANPANFPPHKSDRENGVAA